MWREKELRACGFVLTLFIPEVVFAVACWLQAHECRYCWKHLSQGHTFFPLPFLSDYSFLFLTGTHVTQAGTI